MIGCQQYRQLLIEVFEQWSLIYPVFENIIFIKSSVVVAPLQQYQVMYFKRATRSCDIIG